MNDQVALVNQIITTIQAETKEADFVSLSVAERAEQLLALFDRQNSIWALDEKAQVVVLSSFMRKFVCSPGERSHPAREALSIASRCFMFMYFLLPH